MYDGKFYDEKWKSVIKLLPRGGDYRMDMREYINDEIMKHIPDGAKVFDFACGLGQIDIILEEMKGCRCYGCDFSAVAVEYVNMNISEGEFRHTDKIFGDHYDVILGIAYLEHTNQPRQWIDEMLKYTDKLIVTIPNNYRQQGEHYLMQWSNWVEFTQLLEGLNYERVDDYQDSNHHNAWKSPIIIITKEKIMHPSYRQEDKPTKKIVKKTVIKKVAKKKRKKAVEVKEETVIAND